MNSEPDTLSAERAEALAALRDDPAFTAAPPALQGWLLALVEQGVVAETESPATRRRAIESAGAELPAPAQRKEAARA